MLVLGTAFALVAFALVAFALVAVALVAVALVAFVLGPVISSAVSRRREFLTDASGVELTRYPEGLVRALEKIQAHPTTVQAVSFEARGLFFVNTIGTGWLAGWLSSHPPVAERVQRLRQIGRGFSTGAVWSGLERSGAPRRLTQTLDE